MFIQSIGKWFKTDNDQIAKAYKKGCLDTHNKALIDYNKMMSEKDKEYKKIVNEYEKRINELKSDHRKDIVERESNFKETLEEVNTVHRDKIRDLQDSAEIVMNTNYELKRDLCNKLDTTERVLRKLRVIATNGIDDLNVVIRSHQRISVIPDILKDLEFIIDKTIESIPTLELSSKNYEHYVILKSEGSSVNQ